MAKKMMIYLVLVFNVVVSRRMVRQVLDSDERLKNQPPQVCCRCIDQDATCNNDIAKIDTSPGINCDGIDVECELFEDCNSDKMGCKVQGLNVVDTSELIDLRQKGQPQCPSGQKMCCNPGPGGGFEKGLLPFIGDNNLEDVIVDTAAICENSKLTAVQDFGHGIVCGKRDSRVYYDADLEEGYTNPGEWPWAALIFNNGEYIGAGAMMENDVVVTVGHKVKEFVEDPSGLTVRLGDWNPNKKDRDEEFPHIEVPVVCVKIHPNADLRGSLANNVAVLKLQSGNTDDTTTKPVSGGKTPITVFDVVSPRKGPKRPANRPKGVKGSSVVKGVSSLDVALGFVSEVPGSVLGLRSSIEVPRSYINTVCLPTNEGQFENYRENCWVAAWGMDRKRQREVDMPLVSKSDCERRLGPLFNERGVPNWRLNPSEICAGGVPGKDTCQGEGGAPLVCYDKNSDLYFAVGLVNYGFDCNTDKPAVYTNLADPEVKQFITSAFGNNQFC